MITGRREVFLWRAAQRGYLPTEVMGCVVARDGDVWTVDENHQSYPRFSKPGFTLGISQQPAQLCLPGAELHLLFARVGLTASGDCKCNSRAAYMDQMGCDWCEANIEEIVGWLRESAAERGLPFLDVAGRMLVRRAIHNARRKEQARAQASAQAEGGAAAG